MKEFVIYGLGSKLKALRKKHNLSQKEVAERFDVHLQTVSKWENDVAVPTLQTLIQYATSFNVSLDYLVGFDKQSYLYLEEFTEEQQKYIVDLIHGLKEHFDYGE